MPYITSSPFGRGLSLLRLYGSCHRVRDVFGGLFQEYLGTLWTGALLLLFAGFGVSTFPDESGLLFPLYVEYATSVQLGGAKGSMQYRRSDLEGNLPLIPQATEEIHCNNGFEDGAAKGGDACEHEQAAEESVGVWIHTIEDHGDVWQHLADNVKGACSMVSQTLDGHGMRDPTPDTTENELYRCVFLAGYIETDGDGCLGHQDGTHVMYYRHWRDLDPVDEFEDVHGDQEIGTDNQDVSQGDPRPGCEGLVEVTGPERNVYKRIHADNEDEEFDRTGEMVVDETSTIGFVLSREHVAIDPSQQPFLDHVLLDEEEDDEDDGDDQAGVG